MTLLVIKNSVARKITTPPGLLSFFAWKYYLKRELYRINAFAISNIANHGKL